MAFLQGQVPFPNAYLDYKKTVFSFDANQIHPIEHMGMHRKYGEMFFYDMTNTAMALSKLITVISNVQSQLNIEKVSSLEKGNRVRLYKLPEIFSDSPKSEEELDVHLPELKPTDFISPTHYTFPYYFCPT